MPAAASVGTATMGLCGTDLIKDGWFSERGALWPGQAMSLEVTEVLYSGRSDFQDLLVFTNPAYGTVLVLDGVIQVTSRDEFAYQEMIAHLPLYAHPAPVDVLVIGGGDGGVLREVLKHPSVRRAVLVEIDAAVVAAAKRFLPALAAGFDDPRVEVVIADGAAYMADHADAYDVIITDSSDPIGPAEVLFQPPFYAALARSLRPGGIACCQGECMWLHLGLIRPLLTACRRVFPTVGYAYAAVPTYPSGQIGFVVCAKAADAAVAAPLRTPPADVQARLRYYSPAIHRAAFVLPEFARRAVEGGDDGEGEPAAAADATAAAATVAGGDSKQADP